MKTTKIPGEFLIWFVPSAALIGIFIRAGGPLPDWFWSYALWALAGIAVITGVVFAVREFSGGGGRIGNRPGPRIETPGHYVPDEDETELTRR